MWAREHHDSSLSINEEYTRKVMTNTSGMAVRPLVLTDRINDRGYAIAPVHLSVCLFPFYLRNRLTVDLEFLQASRS